MLRSGLCGRWGLRHTTPSWGRPSEAARVVLRHGWGVRGRAFRPPGGAFPSIQGIWLDPEGGRWGRAGLALSEWGGSLVDRRGDGASLVINQCLAYAALWSTRE